MTSSRYNNLAHLSSMDALKKAKRKIKRDMSRSEQGISDSYHDFLGMFSLRSLACRASGGGGRLMNIARYAVYGYDFVSDLISGRRQKRGRC